MAKVICFFIQIPLTNRDYERFGAEILQKKGFKVIFLDLSMILSPDYVKNYKAHDPSSFEGIISINTWDELSEYFRANSIYLAVDLMGVDMRNILLYRILKKQKIKYLSIRNNSTPRPVPSYKNSSLSLGEKLTRILKRLKDPRIANDIKEIIKKTGSRIYTSNTYSPAFIVEGGKVWSTKMPKPSIDTKIISAHTLDYDLYLKKKMREPDRVSKNDSIVFLDEYAPHHPVRFLNPGADYYLTPENYYRGLRKFFSYIEKKMGLPVKIAAHPSSRYDLHPDYFGGREVILGKTIDLVFDSKLVLTHSSTSINFTVLYRKPCIFLTSNEINTTNIAALIKIFADQFNKKPVNVDEDLGICLDDELNINNNAYDAYRSNFIKLPGTPEKLFWEIVADNV